MNTTQHNLKFEQILAGIVIGLAIGAMVGRSFASSVGESREIMAHAMENRPTKSRVMQDADAAAFKADVERQQQDGAGHFGVPAAVAAPEVLDREDSHQPQAF